MEVEEAHRLGGQLPDQLAGLTCWVMGVEFFLD